MVVAIYNPVVTVCDKCHRACCWQGVFMCDDAYDAGTEKRNVIDLVEMNEEHPDYWNNELNSGNNRLLTPDDLQKLGASGDNLELSEEPGHV